MLFNIYSAIRIAFIQKVSNVFDDYPRYLKRYLNTRQFSDNFVSVRISGVVLRKLSKVLKTL